MHTLMAMIAPAGHFIDPVDPVPPGCRRLPRPRADQDVLEERTGAGAHRDDSGERTPVQEEPIGLRAADPARPAPPTGGNFRETMDGIGETIRRQSDEIARRAAWLEGARTRLWERMDRMREVQGPGAAVPADAVDPAVPDRAGG
jgi:hypothetical protein